MLLEDLVILNFYISWMSKMQNYFYHVVQRLHNFWQLMLLWHLLTTSKFEIIREVFQSLPNFL